MTERSEKKEFLIGDSLLTMLGDSLALVQAAVSGCRNEDLELTEKNLFNVLDSIFFELSRDIRRVDMLYKFKIDLDPEDLREWIAMEEIADLVGKTPETIREWITFNRDPGEEERRPLDGGFQKGGTGRTTFMKYLGPEEAAFLRRALSRHDGASLCPDCRRDEQERLTDVLELLRLDLWEASGRSAEFPRARPAGAGGALEGDRSGASFHAPR